jgi:hypothetical protein
VSDSVTIEQVRCRYRIRGRHANTAEIRWRLDGIIRDRVPALCEQALASRIPPGPGVVLIRRLDLKLAFGHGLREPHVAEVWTEAIRIALSRALADTNAERVVRFDSRAGQLAELCSDLAAGTAWSKWHHAGFSHLRGSTASAAVRRALVDEPREIAAVLRILRRRGRLRRVGTALSDSAAWAIVAAVLPEAGGPPARQVLGPERLREAIGAGPPPSVALELLAALAEGDAVTPRNVELVCRIARAAPLLIARQAGARSRRTDTPRAEGGGEATESLRLLSIEEPELVRAAQAAIDGTAEAASGAEVDIELFTSYGGVFLLLPALSAFDIESRLSESGLDEDEAVRTAALGRWLVLLKCLEPSVRLGARFDTGLVAAAGLFSPPDDRALTRLGDVTSARVSAALVHGTAPRPPAHFAAADLVGARRGDRAWSRVAAAVLDVFARGLPGFESSSPGHLARNFLVGESFVRLTEIGTEVTLPRTPLEVVLRVAGWRDSVHAVPWLPGGTLLVTRADE